MKQALLAVSFGTSVPEAEKSIRAVERALAATAHGFDFFRAYTSPSIRRALAKRGEPTPALEDVLEQLEKDGYDCVLVQPTHILYGIEYDKIKETAALFADSFDRLALGKPLLSGTGELCGLAQEIAQAFAQESGALVLLGHGTQHFANLVYPALQTALRLAGAPHVYVGTVEGWLGFDEVLAQLQAGGEKEVLLAPLMLVAGDHARNDMAGTGPDSWASKLQAAGFTVRCHLQGLGEMRTVQAIYQAHLQELLDAL